MTQAFKLLESEKMQSWWWRIKKNTIKKIYIWYVYESNFNSFSCSVYGSFKPNLWLNLLITQKSLRIISQFLAYQQVYTALLNTFVKYYMFL